MLQTINDRIEFLLDADHAIGHALLMGIENLWDLRRAFSRRIIPLLQEYFFEDLSKAKVALTGSSKECAFFVERVLDAGVLFDASTDLDDQEARLSIRPNPEPAKWKARDFLSLYLRGGDLAAALADLPTDVAPEQEPGFDPEQADEDERCRRAGKDQANSAQDGAAGAANDDPAAPGEPEPGPKNHGSGSRDGDDEEAA